MLWPCYPCSAFNVLRSRGMEPNEACALALKVAASVGESFGMINATFHLGSGSPSKPDSRSRSGTPQDSNASMPRIIHSDAGVRRLQLLPK
jgi:hypothetical protein